jgi:hypothetical protein
MLADATQDDGPLNPCDRMQGQTLQHTDILPRSGSGALLLLQVVPELAENGRQLPAAKDVGMIQRRRPSAQARQVVDGFEDLLALAIAAWMAGDRLAVRDDLDVLDVSLDRHLAKGMGARHAVVVVVEADGLVLVHLG